MSTTSPTTERYAKTEITSSASASAAAAASHEAHHGPPPDGLECLVTMEDIDDSNYVEYQCFPSLQWKPSLMEQAVVEELLQTQFHRYIERVKTTDCQAELRRLLATGPPVYVSDPHGMPLEENGKETDTHISKLWFSSDKTERSAKLHGALEGDERKALWQELQQFVIVEGKEDGDDDEVIVVDDNQ